MEPIDIRDALFEEVYRLAQYDKNVVFITADADAFSLRKFKRDMPGQFINAGVAEQNVITLAAGLALSGKKVFIYAIIPFITLRCYEQIKVNICSMNLPVTIIGAGVGFSFSYDGPTHHGVCDVGVMRSLPELEIYNPSEQNAAEYSVKCAYMSNCPSYIRLDKGVLPIINRGDEDLLNGISFVREGEELCILSTGYMVHAANEVSLNLRQFNYNCAVVDVLRLKPINNKILSQICDRFESIVVVEEHVLTGGLGSMVCEFIVDNNKKNRVKRYAIKDEQTFKYGTREWLHKECCLDAKSLIKNIKELTLEKQYDKK